MEAFVMPPSFRHLQQPGNIQVARFSVFTDPANHQCNLAVRALSSWMSRTKTGYFDRVGGNPEGGQRCTEFIVLLEKKKVVIDHLNMLGLQFSYGSDQSIMAQEKSKFGKVSEKNN